MKMNYALTGLFHFLRILTQENELCSDNLVSFFKELDTRQGTLLRRPHHNKQEVIASKSSTPDGRKTSWKSGPNVPNT